MKTARDILFQRHEAAGPNLDALRRDVLARHCAPAGCKPADNSPGFYTRLWRELFWSARGIWTGLAAVWLVLLVVNFTQRDDTHATRAMGAPTPEMMAALRHQEELLNEMLADRSPAVEATRPREFEPKPRSEIAGITAV